MQLLLSEEKIAKIISLSNIITFLKMSIIAPPYCEVGQIRTLEIHGPIYENGLFGPPLVCFSKKKSEKIFSSIVSRFQKMEVGQLRNVRVPDSFYRKRVHWG